MSAHPRVHLGGFPAHLGTRLVGCRRVSAEPRQNLLLPGTERWPLDPDKPVIELVDVSMSFKDKVVLDGLNLKIVPGITTVVVGRSGSGKSVLVKLMMGLLKPTKGKV